VLLYPEAKGISDTAADVEAARHFVLKRMRKAA